MKEEIEAQRLQKVLNLSLKAELIDKEIGKKIGMPRKTVNAKINKMKKKIEELAENPKSEMMPKFRFLAEKTQYCSEFKPYYYNTWFFG